MLEYLGVDKARTKYIMAKCDVFIEDISGWNLTLTGCVGMCDVEDEKKYKTNLLVFNMEVVYNSKRQYSYRFYSPDTNRGEKSNGVIITKCTF